MLNKVSYYGTQQYTLHMGQGKDSWLGAGGSK